MRCSVSLRRIFPLIFGQNVEKLSKLWTNFKLCAKIKAFWGFFEQNILIFFYESCIIIVCICDDYVLLSLFPCFFARLSLQMFKKRGERAVLSAYFQVYSAVIRAYTLYDSGSVKKLIRLFGKSSVKTV